MGDGEFTDRIRVGVIGCGAIAQLMHLPYLRELDDRFELFALCDIDAATLNQVADHYGVSARHQDVAGLLAEPLDLVMILTSGDHTETTLAAIERGRHVFVEKPLAYTLRQTDAIIEASRNSDRVLMIGMMKQYDPGYRRGVAAVHELQDLRYVDARVMHPDNNLYMSHHRIDRGERIAPTPVPVNERIFGASFFDNVQGAILGHESRELLREATGSDRPEVMTAYLLLISSSIHDAAVLRGVLGRPERVVNAVTWAGGTSFTATLAYPNDVRLNYTWSLLPYLKHYEQDYSFFASDGRVHIRFPSPYLRSEPTLVDIEVSEGEELRVTRVITSYDEAFKLELIHLHECIVQHQPPHTDAEGFRTDLEVLTDIARAL